MDVSGHFYGPAALNTGKERRGVHWIGSWVGRSGCGEEKNVLPLLGIEPQSSSP
jgi:hypothetical protein